MCILEEEIGGITLEKLHDVVFAVSWYLYNLDSLFYVLS